MRKVIQWALVLVLQSAGKMNPEINMVSIQIGKKVFEVQLNDTESAANFRRILPLNMTMQDLSNNEKFYQFGKNIAAESSKSYTQINNGDIMIYSGRYIVLFYKTFSQDSYQYVKIGNILDTTGLAEAVGNGSIEISWREK